MLVLIKMILKKVSLKIHEFFFSIVLNGVMSSKSEKHILVFTIYLGSVAIINNPVI